MQAARAVETATFFSLSRLAHHAQMQHCGGIDGSRTDLDFLYYQIQSYDSTVTTDGEETRPGSGGGHPGASSHEIIKAGILAASVP